MTAHRTALRVELGARSYQIHIAPDLLRDAGRLIAEAVDFDRAFVVTNPVVERRHGAALRDGLRGLPCETVVVPAGERQKCLRRASRLYDGLLARGADRRCGVIAFGGGVIGDLAGFVAATYMRGIAYIQIPTTLLAQVDSSVGGKVAVDHPKAKNLIGAFYQPRLVLADPGVLRSLPAREYRAGLAEVVKHGLIADAELFGWLERNCGPLRRRDPDAISHVVRRSCEIKAEVVRRDERESGQRAILNFGHTVGHALETLTGYRTLRHGEAVAIGMVAASRLAQALGRFPMAEADRLERLLKTLSLPVRIPPVPADDVLRAMRSDKKAVGGAPRFVLPRAIGSVAIGAEVRPEEIARVLTNLGALPRG